MLDLDSSRWSELELSHRGAKATDIPALVRRFYDGPGHEDIVALYEIVDHQSIGTALFAILPHIVHACSNADEPIRRQAIGWVATVLTGECYDVVPEDLRAEVAVALATTSGWAEAQLPDCQEAHRLYMIQAIAACSGRPGLAWLIELVNENEELILTCQACTKVLSAQRHEDGYIVFPVELDEPTESTVKARRGDVPEHPDHTWLVEEFDQGLVEIERMNTFFAFEYKCPKCHSCNNMYKSACASCRFVSI